MVGAVVDAPYIVELIAVPVESVRPEERVAKVSAQSSVFQKDHKLELLIAFVTACTSKPSVIYQIEDISQTRCTTLQWYAPRQGNMPILEPRYLQK